MFSVFFFFKEKKHVKNKICFSGSSLGIGLGFEASFEGIGYELCCEEKKTSNIALTALIYDQ